MCPVVNMLSHGRSAEIFGIQLIFDHTKTFQILLGPDLEQTSPGQLGKTVFLDKIYENVSSQKNTQCGCVKDDMLQKKGRGFFAADFSIQIRSLSLLLTRIHIPNGVCNPKVEGGFTRLKFVLTYFLVEENSKYP